MDVSTTIALAATMLICGIAPLVVAVAVGRRLNVPLRVVTTAVGFYALNIVAQQPFFVAIRPIFAGASPLVIMTIGTPIVYAVSEEVLRWFSWRAGGTMRAHRTSNGAIVAGLAWGGAESLFLTGLQVAGSVAGGTTVGFLVAFALGRVCAIVAHVGFAHLSVAAYRRSVLFLPLVIAVHFAVDASVFGLTAALDPSSAWPGVLFGVIAVVAVAVSVRLRRQWAEPENSAQLAEHRS